MARSAQVIFVVPPRVHVLDLTGPIQVFYEAAEYGAPYQLIYCSFQSSVTSSAGLNFGAVLPYNEVQTQPGDYIFLPGMEMEYIRSALNEETIFFDWLQQQQAKGVYLCSVCTGAFILAQAGLLDGRKCTTHWKRIDELQATYPKVVAQTDRLFVKDGNLYTSAGITAGIDLALAILEEQEGPLFATKIARELVVYFRRGAEHTQKSVYLDYRNHMNVAIHQMQDWLIANLEAKATLEDLAEIANMSTRNLTRIFRKETGTTIHDYTTQLRLELARTLQHNPGMTMEAIAAKCGFQDARQLRRIWQKSNTTATVRQSFTS
ncbi:GlxA family transcriptional regulator [Spirosoma foliorum]|uniref:DJ-1/PfpI family protein n=1 Tax=Spirosoma foliorum TaxID=2710596 RepID=A0A7G5H4U7_9BACT|nr:DJ-1/PfpI family protein [Spirosoma foliorum]QMW06139.1 DJ-1/PfpI family protein [Spirosoma foliorum]